MNTFRADSAVSSTPNPTAWVAQATLPADAPPCAHRLVSVVDASTPALLAIGEEESARRRSPEAWSRREIIGHLIDSASNNHQRFVRWRGRTDLVVDGYEQNEWVSSQRYQDAQWPELVLLWQLYNRHLARVMTATPVADRDRARGTHNLDQRAFNAVPPDRAVTLEYLMSDYVAHLEHHLAQVLG